MNAKHSLAEELEDIEACFHLSHAILVDPLQTRMVTAEAMRSRPTVHIRQQKRQYYDWKSRKPREIVVLPKSFLLNSLIFLESTKYEIEQEKELLRGERLIHEHTLLLRYIKYLVQISLSRSFYLSVTICRILHSYTHRQTKFIYESLLQGIKFEEQGKLDPRYKEDDAYRHWKKEVMDKVETRFNGMLSRRTVAHGEERFIPQENIRELIPYTEKCLRLLTPWKTEHVLPKGWPRNGPDIPAFKFEYGYRDGEHIYEVNRMHGIIDPDCFSPYTLGLGCPAPEERLDLPRFFLPGAEGNDMKPSVDLEIPAKPDGEDLRAILKVLSVETLNRKNSFAPILSIVTDGTEQHPSFNTRESKLAHFKLDPKTELLKIFARQGDADILLTTLLIGYSGVRDGEPWESSLTLEGNQEVSLSITPEVNVHDVVTSLAVDLRYRERSPSKALRLGYLRLKHKLDSSKIRLTRAPRWVTAICILVLFVLTLNILSSNTYSAAPRLMRPSEALEQSYIPVASDRTGDRATFEIYLLSSEYHWAANSTTQLQDGRREFAFTDQMKANMDSATAIICVGASSETSIASLQDVKKVEETRAARRAETLAYWVRSALTKPIPVYKLNIGYHIPVHDSSLTNETSDQRRIIIILVLKEEKGINLAEALRTAFTLKANENPIYGVILKEYSLFEFD